MWWKSWGVIVISQSAMWKVWVVSHHILAKVYTEIALADLSGNRQMIGSKPAAQMWPRVSLVRMLYHTNTRLVLPLPESKVETYKKRMGLYL